MMLLGAKHFIIMFILHSMYIIQPMVFEMERSKPSYSQIIQPICIMLNRIQLNRIYIRQSAAKNTSPKPDTSKNWLGQVKIT